MVSGFTQVVAVIGHPITQVKSPENFNRYFAERQMDSVMIPVDIAPHAVADYLNTLRGWHNMSGVLVTVPHKQRAAALVDELTPRARHLNAVNVIRKLADGRLQGDMLDGVGFQLAAEAHGFNAAGKKALLSGCGGVGSAIAWGLCEAGILQLALHDQNPATLQQLHNRLAAHFPHVQLSDLPATLTGLDLVVNGSPAGMTGFASLPLPQALLETLGEPMLSTSLMLPGSEFTESDPEEIKDRLEKVVELIIHGGYLGQQPTTVVDLTEDAPEVIREGVGDVKPFL